MEEAPTEEPTPEPTPDPDQLADETHPYVSWAYVGGKCRSPQEISGLLSRLGAAATEEFEALIEFQKVINRIGGLNDNYEEMIARLDKAHARVVDAETSVAAVKARRQLAKDRLNEVTEELVLARERLKEQAVEAYVDNNVTDVVGAIILGGGTVTEIQTATEYAQVILEEQQKTIDRVIELEASQGQLIDDLAIAVKEAKAAVERVEGLTAVLDGIAKRLEQEIDLESDQVHGHIEKIQGIRGTKNAVAAQLGAVEPETLDALMIALQAATLGEPGVDDGRMGLPLPGLQVASTFGLRLHPIFGDLRMHTGLDLSSPGGMPIMAVQGGRVITAASLPGYGLVVEIDHGSGLSTLYAHMSGFAVGHGQEITKGQTIGLVGSTGYSTGPHLHLEVRVLGNPVDPLPYLAGAGAG